MERLIFCTVSVLTQNQIDAGQLAERSTEEDWRFLGVGGTWG